MGFLERFRKPKTEVAAAALAGAIGAASPTLAAEAPQAAPMQNPNEIRLNTAAPEPETIVFNGQKIELSVPAEYQQKEVAPVLEPQTSTPGGFIRNQIQETVGSVRDTVVPASTRAPLMAEPTIRQMVPAPEVRKNILTPEPKVRQPLAEPGIRKLEPLPEVQKLALEPEKRSQ